VSERDDDSPRQPQGAPADAAPRPAPLDDPPETADPLGAQDPTQPISGLDRVRPPGPPPSRSGPPSRFGPPASPPSGPPASPPTGYGPPAGFPSPPGYPPSSGYPAPSQGSQWPGPNAASAPILPNAASTPTSPLARRSLVDGIQSTESAPRVTPRRGWRRVVYRATFGLVNLGPSPDERRLAALEATIRLPIHGNFRIGVLGKGGVGKTTVAACVGLVFAQLRTGDRVVAVDADTAFGKLASRVDPKAAGSYWELVSDQYSDTFAEIRNRIGNNAAGLFVLAGDAATTRRRMLEPAIYRAATARLNRHFTISIVDCGSSMDSPVTDAALRDLDALIVVSSPWVDGASAAGQTLEWLADRSMPGLLRRTVVVLNDSDGHANKRTRSVLAQQFASRGQVVVQVPFDPHLRRGGVIDTASDLAPSVRRRFMEIAAVIAEHFPSTPDRATRAGGHVR
jgi:MinD-like ATPase involved in chromosome partitioning or flagellar assembly